MRKSKTRSGWPTAIPPKSRAPQPTRSSADVNALGVGPAVGGKWQLGARQSSAKIFRQWKVPDLLDDRLTVVAQAPRDVIGQFAGIADGADIVEQVTRDGI